MGYTMLQVHSRLSYAVAKSKYPPEISATLDPDTRESTPNSDSTVDVLSRNVRTVIAASVVFDITERINRVYMGLSWY